MSMQQSQPYGPSTAGLASAIRLLSSVHHGRPLAAPWPCSFTAQYMAFLLFLSPPISKCLQRCKHEHKLELARKA